MTGRPVGAGAGDGLTGPGVQLQAEAQDGRAPGAGVVDVDAVGVVEDREVLGYLDDVAASALLLASVHAGAPGEDDEEADGDDEGAGPVLVGGDREEGAHAEAPPTRRSGWVGGGASTRWTMRIRTLTSPIGDGTDPR